jgi:hypothetical protein
MSLNLDVEPTLAGVVRLIGRAFAWVHRDRVARLLGSAMVLLLLWGTHGNVDLLGKVLPGWTGPGGEPHARARLVEAIPWDQEWIAFGIGAVLLVLVPCVLIRYWFRESPLDYGLGLPRPGTWRFTLVSMGVLAAFGFPALYLASKDREMAATYPFFRQFQSTTQFWIYELGYFAFFLVIEFVFRGYLLLGLYRTHAQRDNRGAGAAGAAESPPATIGAYSVLVSMLSYTAWHLGKPLAEQWSTLLWGLATGVMVLVSGTIWHVVLVHWGMNVLLDYAVWTGGEP